jgi:hypothetical protein
MPPLDRTPLGDEMVENLPGRKFPQPKPTGADGSASRDSADDLDIGRRPALPERPEQMAADVEDEEADPVVDRGPGIADGLEGPRKQKG